MLQCYEAFKQFVAQIASFSLIRNLGLIATFSCGVSSISTPTIGGGVLSSQILEPEG